MSAQAKLGDDALPVHVAIIMDGNGRWAKRRHLPRVAGHKRGAEAVRECVKNCGEIGIKYLTLYAFSSENWSRPADEVADLMGLLRLYLEREVTELNRQNVRLHFIGVRTRLPEDTLKLIDHAETTTAQNDGLNLVIALNYGAQQEILEAVKRICAKAETGEVSARDICEQTIAQHLFTSDIPDPDLIIRTSGEQRLSNFMLWQAAYAELVFLDVLWPDFTRAALNDALEEYHRRDRRFGGR